MIVNVESLDDARLDVYARLTDVALRSKIEPELGIFIAEGEKVIARALEAGYEPLSFLLEEKWLAQLGPCISAAQAGTPELPVFIAPHEELQRLAGFEVTRGALAAFRRPPLPSVRELLKDAHRVAIFEDVTNHTNVGAAFRSAAALGVDAVLVTPACYDPLYRRAVRVSMGTVFQVPWTRIGASEQAWAETGVDELHKLGFATAAFALCDNSISLDDPRLKAAPKLAMVFGTEGDGLAAETIARCDYTVRIPMAHGVDSLNVAASAAVAFWELCPRG